MVVVRFAVNDKSTARLSSWCIEFSVCLAKVFCFCSLISCEATLSIFFFNVSDATSTCFCFSGVCQILTDGDLLTICFLTTRPWRLDVVNGCRKIQWKCLGKCRRTSVILQVVIAVFIEFGKPSGRNTAMLYALYGTGGKAIIWKNIIYAILVLDASLLQQDD